MKFSLLCAAAVVGSNLVLPTYAALCPNGQDIETNSYGVVCRGGITRFSLRRLLMEGEELEGGEVFIFRPPRSRRLSGTNVSPSHMLHLIANEGGLSQNCAGCKIAVAIIQSSVCNTNEAHDNAEMIPLQEDLTYDTKEDGSTDNWISHPIRELKYSDSNIEHFLAVYFYDMDDEFVACATLELASEEESKMYHELFSPAAAAVADEEGDGEEKPLGASSTGIRVVGLVSAAVVVGVSLLMSVVVAA